MLDAAAFAEASAADEFAFLGFGKECVLRELLGFDFEDALGSCGFVGCPELKTNYTFRMEECVCDGVEKRFEVLGIVHLCRRELDDGARTSPVKGANRRGRREKRFHFEVFDSAGF